MFKLRNWKALTAWLTIAAGLIAVGMVSCNSQPKLSRLTIFVSGYTEGYFINCGCSTGQQGGEMRKIAMLNEKSEAALQPKPGDNGLPSEVLMIEIGNFLDSSSKAQRVYSECVMEATVAQNYQAVGLGRNELAYSQAELWAMLKDQDLKLVAANLVFLPPEKGEDWSTELNALHKPYRIHEYSNGFKIGMIHVLDDAAIENLGSQTSCKISNAVDAANRVLAAHKNEANFWVLSVGSANREGTPAEEVAAIKGIDVVVGYMFDNPLTSPEDGKAAWPFFVRRPYRKAKDLVEAVFHLQSDSGRPIVTATRYQIPDTLEPDPDANECYARIKIKLDQIASDEAEDQLNAEKIPPLYVGFNQCFVCHEETWEKLKFSKHASAYDSLVEQDQHGSDACLPCHVLGYKEPSGWNKINNEEYLRGVSCESCHGPGQYHQGLMEALLFNESFEMPEDLSADGRNELGLQEASEETCMKCHDEDNSLEFEFDLFWSKIAH